MLLQQIEGNEIDEHRDDARIPVAQRATAVVAGAIDDKLIGDARDLQPQEILELLVKRLDEVFTAVLVHTLCAGLGGFTVYYCKNFRLNDRVYTLKVESSKTTMVNAADGSEKGYAARIL